MRVEARDGGAQVRVDCMRIRQVPFLSAATPMYDLLRLFQTGRSHMVFLRKPPACQEEPPAATDVNVHSEPGGAPHPALPAPSRSPSRPPPPLPATARWRPAPARLRHPDPLASAALRHAWQRSASCPEHQRCCTNVIAAASQAWRERLRGCGAGRRTTLRHSLLLRAAQRKGTSWGSSLSRTSLRSSSVNAPPSAVGSRGASSAARLWRPCTSLERRLAAVHCAIQSAFTPDI